MVDAQRRKELKSQYAQQRPQAGVYRIRHAVTGNALLGSSTNLGSTKNRFDFAVKHKSTGALDQRLKQDALTHGFDALTFEVLETIEPGPDVTENELKLELHTLEELCRDDLVERTLG
jgi:hypothetical protein